MLKASNLMADTFTTESDSYAVVEELRSRAGGGTFLVERGSDEARLILKALSMQELREWKHFELFEREVAALRAIDHPRVPKYVDSHLDEAQGMFVLVQDRVPGKTLRQLIQTQHTFSADETEQLLKQCLEVVRDLHERSPPVIHRDLTLSNIMVAEDGIYLIDFGAVKVGEHGATSMTTVGTFGYMAPEQLLGKATTQSDLYSLGISFVSLIAGLEPIDLPQDPATGQVDLNAVLKSTSGALQRTLRSLTQPGLGARARSASAALALLERAPPSPGPPVQLQLSQSRYVGSRQIQLSPYRSPERLSDEDKAYLKQHELQSFSALGAVALHFLTFGLFSVIHFGLQHDRLPKAMDSDPSSARAIGFSFIPYFNFYWWIFNPIRLADRLNAQSRIRDEEDIVSKGLITLCSIISVVPYLNILLGLPVWGVGVYKLQKAINQLSEERMLELGDGDMQERLQPPEDLEDSLDAEAQKLLDEETQS